MELKSERISIREFRADDVTDLYEILGDEKVMFYCEPAYSFEMTKAFLIEFCLGKRPVPAFALVLKTSGKVIGYLLFKCLDSKNEKLFELGWWINQNFWHQGFAYEACQLLINHAFTKKIADRIVSETIDQNRARPLMEKLGMTKIELEKRQGKDNSGLLHDVIWYELKNK